MSYKLKLTEPLERGVRRIAIAQIDGAIARLQAEREESHVVHTARKGLKKLRALLRLVRPGLEAGVFDRENVRLRDIARQLSPLRDQHVIAETVKMLAADVARAAAHTEPVKAGPVKAGPVKAGPVKAGPVKARPVKPNPATSAFVALAKRLNERPPGIPAADNASDTGNVLAATVAELQETRSALEKIEIDGGHATAFAGITDSYRKARRAMHHGFTTLDAEDLHEFRKYAQHHWRHMQLVSLSWPEYFEARAMSARRLSTILGTDHDLEVLASYVASHDGPRLTARQREHVLSIIHSHQAGLRADANRLGQQLFADPPSVFGQTVAFHWTTAGESASGHKNKATAAE